MHMISFHQSLLTTLTAEFSYSVQHCKTDRAIFIAYTFFIVVLRN